MGSGWSDLVRVPFFSFLPNFFLGVVLLYVLEWTGVIKKWSQLFAPIYHLGPAEMIPSWLVAFFILTVVFGLGLVVSSIGEFMTTWPFQIEDIEEEYKKHVYFYEYSNPPKNNEDYPTTIRYTPFMEEAIHHGILWHIFRGENPAAEVTEKNFAINAPIYSGLFVLALLYFGIELTQEIIRGQKEQWSLTIIISLLALSIIIVAPLCGRKKDILNSLEATPKFDLGWRKRQLYHILECHELMYLILICGVILLGILGTNNEKLESPIRLTLVLLLALKFYANSVHNKIHANALDYTNYWKVIKGEEARKKAGGRKSRFKVP